MRREIGRIDPDGITEALIVQCLNRRVAGQCLGFWLVIRLEQTAARIDSGIIKFATLGWLNLQLGRTTFVALFDDFERHCARHDSQVQADREQQNADSAAAERNVVASNPLNHSAFLDL